MEEDLRDDPAASRRVEVAIVTFGGGARMLMDLEQRRVIDLLPDRSQDTLVAWLRQHPGVQLITRDRSGEYAAGAALGAPLAQQIADRFHLLLNVGEVLERYLTRQHVSLREAARTLGPLDAPRRGDHRAARLQADWNSYGADAFEFVVLEEVSAQHVTSPAGYCYRSYQHVFEREGYYIRKHRPAYNTRPY